MDGLTGLVLLLGAAGVLMLPPRGGLMVYLIITLLYPDYMRISTGAVEINAERIAICLLLGKCLADGAVRQQFRWHRLDTAVFVSVCVYAATLLFTTPLGDWLKNRGGEAMDTFFVYLAIRLVAKDRAALVTMFKVVGGVLVVLAGLAVGETLWGWNPYRFLASYSTHVPHGFEYDVRYGFNRAGGPWISSIMFGLMFASFLPVIRLLRYEPAPWRKWAKWLAIAPVIGTLATLSSGPYMMLMTVGFCLLLERFKTLVRPVLVVTITGCLLVEIVSNRHFYDVVADRFAMDGGNAWYRSQLMRVAVRKLPDYWLVGYGLEDPGWGPLIDERQITDVCNNYVLHMSIYGVPGLLAFLAVLTTGMQLTIRAYRASPDPWVRSLAWALAASMVGLMLAFFTVSLFKIMLTVFYILVGLQGAAYQIARPRRTVTLRKRTRVRTGPFFVAGAAA